MFDACRVAANACRTRFCIRDSVRKGECQVDLGKRGWLRDVEDGIGIGY